MIALIFAKLSMFFFAVPAAGTACNLDKSARFFFLPPWWRYLSGQADGLGGCVPHVVFPNGVWLVGLAVLDDMLSVVGFLAVISIMISGVELVISEGNADKATAARNRLINSLIGLTVAFSATALVALVSNTINTSNISGLPQAAATNNNLKSLLDVGFVIVGAFAFLFIVIAGFRYIWAGGNAEKTAAARRQIVYAALGLFVISLASTLVNFVINRLTS